MNLPIDTCDNGSCAFTIRVGYDAKCFAANVGLGGGHFPATSVCVVYQCADGDCGDAHLPQLQGRMGELPRNGVKRDTFNGGH